MTGPAVTVVIPTIPPRAALRARALASVWAQSYPPAAVAVALDVEHAGAAITRQRALQMVATPWVAFLDDDDEWLPNHLARLLWCQQRTDADLVFSWYVPVGMADMVGNFGRPFDPTTPHTITSTVLVRTRLAQRVGFTPPDHELAPDESTGEDDRFVRGLLGLRPQPTIVHLPERTWRYHYHHANTSGRGDKW